MSNQFSTYLSIYRSQHTYSPVGTAMALIYINLDVPYYEPFAHWPQLSGATVAYCELHLHW
jgi:hypothetical protein